MALLLLILPIKSENVNSKGNPSESVASEIPHSMDSAIYAAIFRKNLLQIKAINNQQFNESAIVPNIIIASENNPLTIKFLSKSSPINVEQYLQVSDYPPSAHHQQTFDLMPLIVKQILKKPIHQSVHEIIMPSRKLTQEILPVHEVIKTILSSSSSLPIHNDSYEQKKSIDDNSDNPTINPIKLV